MRNGTSAAFLSAARKVLALGRCGNIKMNEEVAQLVQDAFVSARKQDPKSVNADTCHRWLTLARLTALTNGTPIISPEIFQHVLGMEKARLAREGAVAPQQSRQDEKQHARQESGMAQATSTNGTRVLASPSKNGMIDL